MCAVIRVKLQKRDTHTKKVSTATPRWLYRAKRVKCRREIEESARLAGVMNLVQTLSLSTRGITWMVCVCETHTHTAIVYRGPIATTEFPKAFRYIGIRVCVFYTFRARKNVLKEAFNCILFLWFFFNQQKSNLTTIAWGSLSLIYKLMKK